MNERNPDRKADRRTEYVRGILVVLLMMGLVHCGTRTATSRDSTESSMRTLTNDERAPSPDCPDGGAIAALDTITARPDGQADVTTPCILAGGAMRFATQCDKGPVVFTAVADAGVLTKEGIRCSEAARASEGLEGVTYSFTLPSPSHWCQVGISSDAGGSQIQWVLSESACTSDAGTTKDLIIRGTLDVATTKPGGGGPPDKPR